MTIAELIRAVESKKRILKQEAQEKASYDYILANLVGISIGRLYSNSSHYPEIHEVYPQLFDMPQLIEEKQQKQDELSALRFKLFVDSFNKKKREEGKKLNE